MNIVAFAGTLGTDPETRTTQNGKSVASFRLAVRQWGGDTLWLTVKAWGKTGESVANNMAKGCKVTVGGRLNVDEWEDRDGNKRTTVEVIANDITFHTFPDRDGGREQPQQRREPPRNAPPQGQGASSWGNPQNAPQGGFGSDPIPF